MLWVDVAVGVWLKCASVLGRCEERIARVEHFLLLINWEREEEKDRSELKRNKKINTKSGKQYFDKTFRQAISISPWQGWQRILEINLLHLRPPHS